jgi:hypothetical protein
MWVQKVTIEDDMTQPSTTTKASTNQKYEGKTSTRKCCPKTKADIISRDFKVEMSCMRRL